ncbi:DUF1127 domain-containing protein [Bradyrhizobium sp. 2TAF36]|uniref:DUF1127 domain-containing protein n=1 Tax=Bradyrhizobium sp. 2TAF36 TaxID=3233016 RepID=UPI003F9266B1
MEKYSRSVSRVALPGHMELDRANWVARSDGRGMVRLGAIAARHRAPDIASPPDVPPAGQDQPVTTFWWAVFASLMEGFALYGAALHPTAAAPVQAMLEATRDCRSPSAGREPAEKRGNDGADNNGNDNNGNIVRLDRAEPRDARLERSWNRLGSLGATLGTLMDLPAHWRREREIRKAVAALMEFDDRTLRDLGISGRSDIERVVRYCRDC